MSGRHYGTPKRKDRSLPARDAFKMCQRDSQKKCKHAWVHVGQTGHFQDVDWCSKCGVIRRMKVKYSDVNKAIREGKKIGNLFTYFKPNPNRKTEPKIQCY